MDLMRLPKTKSGHNGVLIAVDNFSKWMNVVPLRNKTARTVFTAVRDRVLPNLPRIPSKMLTDNGKEFRNQIMKRLLSSFNIHHTNSTPYQPSSNGAVERVNRTIIQLLKGLVEKDPSLWDDELHKAVLLYNNTVHSQINTSPSSLLLEQSHSCGKSLPVSEKTQSTWRAGNPKFSPYQIGQRVLYKIQRKGKQVCDKLKNRYDGPFEVVKIQTNQVTYEIKKGSVKC